MLVLIVFLLPFIRASTTCTPQPNCINLQERVALLCDAATATCYVHQNICNSLYTAMASPLIYRNWSIAISTTSYTCLPTNLSDCVNPASILAAPSPQQAPTFCVPINTDNRNSLTFTTVGYLQAVIYTPSPPDAIAYQSCAAFAIKSQTSILAFKNIIFDMSACFTTNPETTVAVVKQAGSISFDTCVFKNVMAALAIPGATCPIVSFTRPAIIGGTQTLTATSILIIAACDGDITVGPQPVTYTAIPTSPLTRITGAVVLNIPLLASISPTQCPPPPPPVEITVTEKPSIDIIAIIIIVSILGAAFIVSLGIHHYEHSSHVRTRQKTD